MYKNTFSNKKAAIFDLDGTLVDTESYWKRAFLAVANTLTGYWVYPEGKEFSGYSMIDKWEHAIREQPREVNITLGELVEKTNQKFLQMLPDDFDVKDGFWPLTVKLKDERGFKLGLVTNTYREVANEILNKLGIKQTFDVVICGDEVDVRKPNPEIYKLASEKLKINPKHMIAFEDSVAGATAASRAGLQTIVIWDGINSQDDYPDSVVDFLPDFTPITNEVIDNTTMDILTKAKELLSGNSN